MSCLGRSIVAVLLALSFFAEPPVAQAQPLPGDCNCNEALDAGDPVCAVLRLIGGFSGSCPSLCGNGVCDGGETVANCPADCSCADPVDCGCPAGYWDRDPTQVVTDLRAAVSAQNETLIACNYHENAFVIDDLGILVGHADILAAIAGLNDLFNGVAPTVNQLDVFMDFARLLYSLDAGWVEIEDGVDTYHVDHGRIRRQSRHGLITFNGPPPDQQ